MENSDFTQKEMLIRLLDKVDCIESKMDKKLGDIHEKINVTHSLAMQTNGKVKINSKLIFGLAGAIVTLTGWLIYILIK